jgi:hypothetical protein
MSHMLAHARVLFPGSLFRPHCVLSLRSYSVLKEGKGEVLQRANDVFYNKAQVRPRAWTPQPA